MCCSYHLILCTLWSLLFILFLNIFDNNIVVNVVLSWTTLHMSYAQTQFIDWWYYYDMRDVWRISSALFGPWYNLIRVRLRWFWWFLRTKIVQDLNTNFRRKNQFWHLMINYQKQICNANCDRHVNIQNV